MARVDDYEESYRLAADQLKRADLRVLAARAGICVSVSGERTVEMKLFFLATPFVIHVGDGVSIAREGTVDKVPLPEQILLCHYILHAPCEPETGRLITFREIPDGQFYFDAFQRRTRDPFLSTFGRDTLLFSRCAERLGGKPVEGGDVARIFQVFPKIAVRMVLWSGDDEFPPEAGILFDANIRNSLPAEDIAVMTGMLVYRLMGIARGLTAKAGSP